MTDDKITTDILDDPKKKNKPIDLTGYREHKKNQAGLGKLFDKVNRWSHEGKMMVVARSKEGIGACLNLDAVLRHCEDMGFSPSDGRGGYLHYYYMPGFKYDKEDKK